MTRRKNKGQVRAGPGRLQRQTRAANEQLILSGLHQHELREAAENLNAQLQAAQAQLASRAVQLEGLVAERTAKLTAAHHQLLAEAEERKHLEGQLVHAVEEEQLRLGEELHDGLAQELAGATMMLYTVEKKLKKVSPEEARTVHKINELLMATGTQARTLARGFYPVDLKRQGLGGALRQLARRTQESFGISCAVKTGKNFSARSKDPRTIQLFRIVQEAVHNAVKHAQARHIHIRLTARGGSSELTVKDDGIGLRPSRKNSRGMGRNIMQYRAGLIGGTLEVRNAEGGGVIVSCVVPKPKTKPKE